MADPDLEHLLARTALGDRTAFQRLYRASQARLFAVCFRVLQDRAQAEEALADAYVKIWRYAERHPASGARALTWMVAIARNIAIDRLRASRAPEAALAAAESVAGGAARRDDRAMRRGSGRALLECLEQLDAGDRRLVRAAYFGGVTPDALAAREGGSPASVRAGLRRKLAALAACLSR
jgi:RNA polymerase sigma-70 factor (ECF subfamily)